MNILVLCTGNSCRSQMAEAFLKSYGLSVKSAGLESHGMNKYAIQVMEEIGFDMSKQYSKTIESIDLKKIDLLITVCDNAKISCPHIPEIKNIFHKSFKDPASFPIKSKNNILIYREVRDEIQQYINHIVKKINNY